MIDQFTNTLGVVMVAGFILNDMLKRVIKEQSLGKKRADASEHQRRKAKAKAERYRKIKARRKKQATLTGNSTDT